jgi:hypothetical protein
MPPRDVNDDTTVLSILSTKPVTTTAPQIGITSPPQPLPIPITHYDDDSPTVAVPIT